MWSYIVFRNCRCLRVLFVFVDFIFVWWILRHLFFWFSCIITISRLRRLVISFGCRLTKFRLENFGGVFKRRFFRNITDHYFIYVPYSFFVRTYFISSCIDWRTVLYFSWIVYSSLDLMKIDFKGNEITIQMAGQIRDKKINGISRSIPNYRELNSRMLSLAKVKLHLNFLYSSRVPYLCEYYFYERTSFCNVISSRS